MLQLGQMFEVVICVGSARDQGQAQAVMPIPGELFNSMVVDLCLPFCCFGNVAEASLRTESLEIWFPCPVSEFHSL